MLISMLAEWEARPTNPTSIRLIYAGQMPGDSAKLGGMYPQQFVSLHEGLMQAALQTAGSHSVPPPTSYT